VAAPTSAGAHASAKHESHDRSYWFVFGALAVLTVVELSIPALMRGMGGVMILALLVVAGVKAILVASYYMHVRFEKRLVAWMAVSPFVLSLILVMLVKSDIRTVDGGGWEHTSQAAQAEAPSGH